MKNERKIGVVLSYASIAISTLVQLLYTPYLIKSLGQSEFGLYSLISSIISYLTILDLGFGNALVVYTSKYRAQGKIEEEKKLHGMFFLIFCFVGFVATILGFILYYNLDLFFGKTMTSLEIQKAKIMMLILTFNLAITFPFSIYSSIINAYEKFAYQKFVAILSTLIKPFIMIPLLMIGFKSITMTIVITVVNIVVLLSNYIYCRKELGVRVRYSGFNTKLFKTIFAYSFFIFLGVIVDKINWSVDQFILGTVSGTIAVSVYSAASQINTLFVNLSTAMSGVLLPKISKMVANNADDAVLTEEFIKVGRLQFLVLFLMVSGLVLFGHEFFITWAGPEYSESYLIAIILTVPLLVPLIQNLGISILQAKNLHKFRSVLYVVIAMVNVFLSIPLAKAYGGIGSACGTAISLIIGNIIIINIYYHKRAGLNIKKFWKVILKMCVPFLIPICFVLVLKSLISLKGIIHIVVFGSIYTILYSIIAYLYVLNSYEKEIVDKILIRFHLRRKG